MFPINTIYRVGKKHNFAKDPKFSKFDLVYIRNFFFNAMKETNNEENKFGKICFMYLEIPFDDTNILLTYTKIVYCCS